MSRCTHPAPVHQIGVRPMQVKLPSRLPSLDGWRAISIVLVLGSHCPRTSGFPPELRPVFQLLFDGDLGVRFFFVISGFLITWLLLREKKQTGQINLGHFYARRALRILPVYLAFLSVIAGLQYFTSYRQSPAAWIGNLSFTTNFIATPWPSGHLWSLSVEEQFYLIWPGVFLLWGITGKTTHLLKSLAAAIVLAPICRVITFKGYHPLVLTPAFPHFSFLNYFDSLAVGCACAMLLAQDWKCLEKQLTRSSQLTGVIGLTLILSPYGFLKLPFSGKHSLLIGVGPTLQAFGFAILILHSIVSPSTSFYRMLNWTWLCWLGVLSYSLYIWQQLFCASPEIFGWKQMWWMSFPGWLLPVFIMAITSYYGLERPLLKLRAYFRKP